MIFALVDSPHAAGHNGVGDSTESASVEKLRHFQVVLGVCILVALEKDPGNPRLTNEAVYWGMKIFSTFDNVGSKIAARELRYARRQLNVLGGRTHAGM